MTLCHMVVRTDCLLPLLLCETRSVRWSLGLPQIKLYHVGKPPHDSTTAC